MSAGSTLRRAKERITGGSIRKREPVSKRSLMNLLENAHKEFLKRQQRLDDAAAIVAHYWALMVQTYPEEAKAIREYEEEMQKQMAQAQAPAEAPANEVVVPTDTK